jgi:hypothetical protein
MYRVLLAGFPAWFGFRLTLAGRFTIYTEGCLRVRFDASRGDRLAALRAQLCLVGLREGKRHVAGFHEIDDKITQVADRGAGEVAGASGDRSGDWVKLRANRGQELVIGGYVPSATTFDSILVGYYEGRDLKYAARIRSGFVPALRQRIFAQFRGLEIEKCPFVNLPERGKGRWGEGLTAEDMEHCRWLKSRLVASIEFLEWTPENRLRHPKFVALRDDQEAEQVVREG